MTEELIESIGFLKAYTTSLRLELGKKEIEIGKLLSYIQELEHERAFVKGDVKKLKQNLLVKQYVEKLDNANHVISTLKKDNENLIYKLNQKK